MCLTRAVPRAAVWCRSLVLRKPICCISCSGVRVGQGDLKQPGLLSTGTSEEVAGRCPISSFSRAQGSFSQNAHSP